MHPLTPHCVRCIILFARFCIPKNQRGGALYGRDALYGVTPVFIIVIIPTARVFVVEFTPAKNNARAERYCNPTITSHPLSEDLRFNLHVENIVPFNVIYSVKIYDVTVQNTSILKVNPNI